MSKPDEGEASASQGRITWKEFKDAVDAAGVCDDDLIWYIDVSFPGEIDVNREDRCGIAVSSFP